MGGDRVVAPGPRTLVPSGPFSNSEEGVYNTTTPKLVSMLAPCHATQVATSVRGVSERLGLSGAEAADLVARVPPVVAAEGRLLQLSIGGEAG